MKIPKINTIFEKSKLCAILRRDLMVMKPKIALKIIPIIIPVGSLTNAETLFSMRIKSNKSKNIAPIVAGTAIMKDPLKASSLSIFTNNSAVMVVPDLLTPGIIVRPCERPTMTI